MASLASRLFERVSRRQLTEPSADLSDLLPEFDPPEMLAGNQGRTIFQADGQTFIIEYRDAQGDLSRRIISVNAIGLMGDDVPYIEATCHAREAPRTFRLDRIERIADRDGEFHSPPGEYLISLLGMPQEMAAQAGRVNNPGSATDRARQEAVWQAVRQRIAPAAQILCALSHSDGLMSKIELDAAVEYLQTITPEMTDGSLNPDRVRLYLRSLHPTAESLSQAIQDLADPTDAKAAVSLVYAGKRLIQIDGELEAGEIDLLNAISQELIGASMV